MRNLKQFALAVLTILTTVVFGQPTHETYQLSFKREAIFLGIGAGTLGSGYWIDTYNSPLTEEKINALDINDLPSYDRWVSKHYSGQAGTWSDVAQNAALAAPLVLFVSSEVRTQWKTVAFMYAETILLTKGITHLTKTIAQRPRPYLYNPEVPLEKKLSETASRSFFSGHTSQTAALSFLAAKTFADYHPESKWRPVFWTAAATLPAATGYLRMRAGKHFLTDVLAGYICGGTIGYLVPHFHKKRLDKSEATGLNIVPTGNGMLVLYRL